MVDVYLNEKFIGNVNDPDAFVNSVKERRRTGKLPLNVNILHNKEFNEIYIESSTGRTRRPLIIVQDGKSLLNKDHLDKLKKNELTWDQLVKMGIIEYLDALEEENAFIALYENELTKEHTHLEIDPVAILGLTTSVIPYSNFGSSSNEYMCLSVKPYNARRMNYIEFQRQLGKAGLNIREFASLVKMNSNSVTNCAQRGEVPSHLAVIASLMGEMADHQID